MKIQDLLLKFQGVKQVSENQYMAICPAHDDHSPSLSIGLSKDRKQILLNCFAGCKAEDILNIVDLRPERRLRRLKSKNVEPITPNISFRL